MFINSEIVLSAFRELRHIAPSSEGKVARERLSGIKYFLATAELTHQKNIATVRIAPDAKDERADFIDAVGHVISLDTAGGYTNNFIDEIDRHPTYKVGNNFLTASLKTNGPYPKRPSPLIDRKNESVSLSADYLKNILAYGEWETYRCFLAVWLLRFDEFDEKDGKDLSILSDKGYQLLVSRYGPAASLLLRNKDELKDLLSQFKAPHLIPDRPDYFFLLKQDLDSPKTSNATIGQNIIYYGAPGTGKSYSLRKFEPSIRTIFHADYQNSDFVGIFRPSTSGGSITYEFVPGPFISAFIEALKDPSKQHYLIIEEINRANAGAIFGEIFQLLDRDETGKSVYSVHADQAAKEYLDKALAGNVAWQGKIYMPSNLTIFATMNSADQGVEPLDSAFKRRWKFQYLPIRFDLISATDVRRTNIIPYAGRFFSWCEIAEACNTILLDIGIEEDRLLGPYFLSESDFVDQNNMDRVVFGKVFIYLWDDVLRHGKRDALFRTDLCRTFYELSKQYRDEERVFSTRFEEALNYQPPLEE